MSEPLEPDTRHTLRRVEQKVNPIAMVAGFAPAYAVYVAAIKEWAMGGTSARLMGIVVWLGVVILIRYQFTSSNSILE